MAAKAFINRIVEANRSIVDPLLFNLQIEVVTIGTTNNNTVYLQFDAPWGADWKLMAKEAIINHFTLGNGYDEGVDGIVFPDMSTT